MIQCLNILDLTTATRAASDSESVLGILMGCQSSVVALATLHI